jgi:hypothetical protein
MSEGLNAGKEERLCGVLRTTLAFPVAKFMKLLSYPKKLREKK